MRIIDIAHPPQSLWIGREGENTFRPVSFECANWFSAYPNATIAAYYQPYGASDPYPLVLTVDGTKRIWHPLLAELVKGDGELQIVLMNGDTVGTSAIIPTKVDRSLISNTDHPASESPSWAVQVVQDVAEDADRAELAVTHYPKIVNGVWHVWSVDAEDFVSTGIEAQGEDGISPTVTVAEIEGGHRVTITGAEGSRMFNVMDGAPGTDGEDGHSPYINNSGYWVFWNDSTGAWVTTNYKAAGTPGADGVSPTVQLTSIQGGTRVTITDKNGPKEFEIDDGVTPSVLVAAIDGGHRVTITGAEGSKIFNVMDGDKGDKGDTGTFAATVTDGVLEIKDLSLMTNVAEVGA